MRQFVGLFTIGNDQCVEIAGASNLELGLGVSLSDFDQSGVCSARLLKEITDIVNLLWHFDFWKGRKRAEKTGM